MRSSVRQAAVAEAPAVVRASVSSPAPNRPARSEHILTTLKDISAAGLTRAEESVIVLTDEPKIPGYLCFPNDAAAARYDAAGAFGQGFHTNDALARIKAVAECLERLCLQNPSRNRLEPATYSPDRCCDPYLFRSLSESQLA